MTARHPFLFIEPGNPSDWSSVARAVRAEQQSMKDMVFDAVSLADSAGDFFRGLFPLETPYFRWGEGRVLPWSDEYWASRADADSVHFDPLPISGDVHRIAVTLVRAGAGEGEFEGPLTYLSSALCESDKLKMQGLAVEAMLGVDRCLHLMLQDDPYRAMRSLSAAYKCIIECTCQAHLILDEGATANVPEPELR